MIVTAAQQERITLKHMPGQQSEAVANKKIHHDVIKNIICKRQELTA